MNNNFSKLSVSCLYNLDKTYDVINNHPDWIYFCSLIKEIQNANFNQSEEYYSGKLNNSLKSMKNVLSRMFGVDFEITIIDNSFSSDFFGCNVYPDEKGMLSVADYIIDNSKKDLSILRDKWVGINKWQIDIDSRLLFDVYCNFNAGEIAVLLIHTIENTVYNTRIIERVNYVITEIMDTQTILVSKLSRASICKKVFVLPIIVACRFHSLPYRLPLCRESCLNKGLSVIFKQMITKVITTCSNENVDRNFKEMDEEIRSAVNFFFACVDDMRYSTKMLTDTVEKLIMQEISPFIKNIYANLLMECGNYNRKECIAKESAIPLEQERFARNDKAVKFRMDQYKRNARQKIDKQFYNILREGFFDLLDNIGNMKRVNQREIDLIKIQAQKIRTVDDKYYVMENLHSKLEIVEASIAMLESKDPDKAKRVKVPKAVLLDQRKQLNDIRSYIIKREVDEPTVNLMVNYPKGYDG